MRECLNCKESIEHRNNLALYCNAMCSEQYRQAMLEIEYEKMIIENIDVKRWAKIGLNSSYEAMRDVYKLFKQ